MKCESKIDKKGSTRALISKRLRWYVKQIWSDTVTQLKTLQLTLTRQTKNRQRYMTYFEFKL